jgi:hypothetical protein
VDCCGTSNPTVVMAPEVRFIVAYSEPVVLGRAGGADREVAS